MSGQSSPEGAAALLWSLVYPFSLALAFSFTLALAFSFTSLWAGAVGANSLPLLCVGH